MRTVFPCMVWVGACQYHMGAKQMLPLCTLPLPFPQFPTHPRVHRPIPPCLGPYLCQASPNLFRSRTACQELQTGLARYWGATYGLK